MRNWTETAKQTRIEVALEQAQKQFEYQKNLVMFEAQRDIASASQAAQSKTSAELMSLEQQFQVAKMQLEQARSAQMMQIEQTAMQLEAQANQAKLYKQMSARDQ